MIPEQLRRHGRVQRHPRAGRQIVQHLVGRGQGVEATAGRLGRLGELLLIHAQPIQFPWRLHHPGFRSRPLSVRLLLADVRRAEPEAIFALAGPGEIALVGRPAPLDFGELERLDLGIGLLAALGGVAIAINVTNDALVESAIVAASALGGTVVSARVLWHGVAERWRRRTQSIVSGLVERATQLSNKDDKADPSLRSG